MSDQPTLSPAGAVGACGLALAIAAVETAEAILLGVSAEWSVYQYERLAGLLSDATDPLVLTDVFGSPYDDFTIPQRYQWDALVAALPLGELRDELLAAWDAYRRADG